MRPDTLQGARPSGGYGDPKERDHSKIIDDVKQGYLSKEYVNKYYPDVKL